MQKVQTGRRGDENVNTMLKIKSKSILTGRNMRASSLMLAAVTAAVLMGAVPSFTEFIPAEITGMLWLKAALNVAAPLIAVAALYPLRAGSEAWFLCGASGREPSALQVVFWYKPSKAIKSIEMRFSLLARKLLWAAVFLAPGISVVSGALYMMMTEGISVKLLAASVAGGGISFLVGLVFYLLMVQRYFLSYAMLARNPGKSAGQAVRQSVEAMNGSCAGTLLFRLSFMPWFLLCLAVFPIIYVWPYYKQSCSCLKYELCRNYSLAEKEREKERQLSETTYETVAASETPQQ